MRGQSGILAAFFGIGAVFYHTVPFAGQTSKAEATNAAATKSASDEGHSTDWDLLRNLAEFYRFDAPRPQKTAINGKISVESAGRLQVNANFPADASKPALTDQQWRDNLQGRFDWILATVPDPELSGMRLDFDREINAIQNAVESGGYHFDRYFFPWTFSNPQSHASDQGSHAEHSDELESKRNLPGMLFFRTSPEAKTDRDLVVFLVGETPTSGIVPGQFESAIRFGELSGPEDPIRIAGPGFSGSFDSLARLIDPKQRKYLNQQYEIRTWTGDFASQKHFRDERPNSHLQATNDSSRYKIYQFCHYVRNVWQEPPSAPIVLLVEEDTAFGSGATAAINESFPEERKASAEERKAFAKERNKRPDHKEKELGLIYVIKFPRGISKLRNATEEKHKIPGFEEPKGADILKRELPFTLKEERVGSSELPFYSAEQSPVSQESMLFNIASLMRKGALHYAGIVASDSLDLLFLSRFLHSATPNTRLFTIDSDLLFEHGVDGSDFQGILSINNYPLFAFNQIWTRSTEANDIQVFPSGNSESIYNAVVQLLPDYEGVQKHYREYANPFTQKFDNLSEDKPPLWITVAGRNGYEPIASLDPPELPWDKDNPPLFNPASTNQQHRQRLASKAPQFPPEYWESWGYSFAFIWCLCLLYAAAVLFANPTGNRLFAIFSVKPDEARPLPRAHFLFLLGLCLSVITALWLAVPYIVLKQNNLFIDPKSTYIWLYNALLLVLSGISLVLCLRLLTGQKFESRPALVHRCGMYFAALALVLLSARFIALHLEIHVILTSALFCAAFAVAAPVRIASTGLFSGWTDERWFSFKWRAVLLLLMICTTVLAVLICSPPGIIENSPSLIRLWKLFYGGAAVFGVVIAASAIPLLDAVQSIKRKNTEQTQEKLPEYWMRSVVSNIYFWLSVLAAVLLSAALFWTAMAIHNPEEASEQFLAACRSINLTSGVSPLAPLTLLMLALAVWCFIQLRRVSYHEDRCPSVPEFKDDVFCPQLQQILRDVENRIAREFFHPSYNVISVLAVFLALLVACMREHQTLESRAMDTVMLALALLIAISLISTCMRFTLIWSAFREVLLQLERHPLREIFSYLPRGFLWVPLWQGGNKKRTHVAITRSLECARALLNSSKTPIGLRYTLATKLPDLESAITKLLTSAAGRRRVKASSYKAIQDQLADIGTAVATELEHNKWPYGSYEAKAELASREMTKGALCVSKDEFQLEEPYTICSELLALRFVPFINYVLLQLQNLAMYLSVGFLLLLTAMNCYVFRARTVIDWLLAALFIMLGGAVITVFSQLDKDAIFSRITRTEEGKLDRNFLSHMVSYGAIPTLALLASHVPSIARFFFSWIKPAMDAIH